MSAALVAVVLSLLLSQFLPALAELRRFEPLLRWQAYCAARFGAFGPGQVLLAVVGPALAVASLHWFTDGRGFGLPGFAFSVIVLFWCWGPRDLDRDVDAWLAAVEPGSGASARALGLSMESSLDGPTAVDAIFCSARKRWFGPLLWFLLLGPAGAVLYRLTQFAAEGSPPRGSALATLRLALDWPVAQLMTLALAVAGNFDAVAVAWRDWHRAQGGFFVGELGFLAAAARASVAFELVTEDQLDPSHTVASPLVAAARDALSMLWRILIVWLAVVAVLVLGGFV